MQAAKYQLASDYDWHQAVWKSFPRQDGETRDYLMRIDHQPGGLRCLILSPRIPVRPGWCQPEYWQTKPIPDAFLSFDRYAFQVRANPVKKDNKTKRLIPLLSIEDQIRWMERKAALSGFRIQVPGVQVLRAQPHVLKDKTYLYSVDFTGILNVTDREKFKQAVAQGIGKGKAFGFGMLVLSPLG